MTSINDLGALALSCSTIHELVSPLIYSRFDIVWPDGLARADGRTGVDALTYGLSTLVMRDDLFGRTYEQTSASSGQGFDQNEPPSARKTIRRGNNYSHHVKKFSLGNGPPNLVREYLITTDAGKLLGTMVALAVVRMPNLESFVWDMPTGIVRDVWINLAEHNHLSKFSVRFHDNKKAYEEAGLVRSTNNTGERAMAETMPEHLQSPLLLNDPAGGRLVPGFYFTKTHVESPNFSVLPSLSAISAIEVGELANLDELSVLIAKSVSALRELRVGIAERLASSGLAVNSRAIQYLDPRYGSSGVLTLLFSGLPQCRPLGQYSDHETAGMVNFKPFIINGSSGQIVELGEARVISASAVSDPDQTGQIKAEIESAEGLSDEPGGTFKFEDDGEKAVQADPTVVRNLQAETEDVDDGFIDPALKSAHALNRQIPGLAAEREPAFVDAKRNDSRLHKTKDAHIDSTVKVELASPISSRLHPKLLLSRLEFERQVLNVAILNTAIDFAVLEHLTLLKCTGTDDLWRYFIGHFQPHKQSSPTTTISPRPFEVDAHGCQSRLRRTPTSIKSRAIKVYCMKLKRIQTDTVSQQLLTFLEETLAANSVEWLFLQDNPEYKSLITINQIWKGPIRRQRGSLTKLLVNSSNRGDRKRPTAAKKWSLHRDALASLVDPKKVPKLRELSISLHYKDFHWFLQQIPNVPTLRALHMPWIIEHVSGNSFNIRDVALNVVDVVNLRRECELAYLAIRDRCYELVEARAVRTGGKRDSLPGTHPDDDDESSVDDPLEEEDVSDDADTDDDAGLGSGAGVEDHIEEEDDSTDTNDDDETVEPGPAATRIRMREILFYDDRVSIFKARHAKL